MGEGELEGMDFKLLTLFCLTCCSVVFAGFSAESLRARIEDGKKIVKLCCHAFAKYSRVHHVMRKKNHPHKIIL